MLLRKSSRPTDREGVGATDRSPSGLRDTPPWAHMVVSSNDSALQRVAFGEHSTAMRRPMRAC